MHSKMLYGGFFYSLFFSFGQLLSTVFVLPRPDLCWRAGSPALFTFCLITLIPAISIVLSFRSPCLPHGFLLSPIFPLRGMLPHLSMTIAHDPPWAIDSHDAFESECPLSYVYLTTSQLRNRKCARRRPILARFPFSHTSWVSAKTIPPTMIFLKHSADTFACPFLPEHSFHTIIALNPQFGPSLYRLSTVDQSSFHAVPNLHLDASMPVILAQFFWSICISMHCPMIFPFELCHWGRRMLM
jgi:hypothetical protein